MTATFASRQHLLESRKVAAVQGNGRLLPELTSRKCCVVIRHAIDVYRAISPTRLTSVVSALSGRIGRPLKAEIVIVRILT